MSAAPYFATIENELVTLILEQDCMGEWRAYQSDWDEGCPVGHGRTQLEAVEDLREQL